MKAAIIPSKRDPGGFDLSVSFKADELTDEREIEALKAAGWRYYVSERGVVTVDIPL